MNTLHKMEQLMDDLQWEMDLNGEFTKESQRIQREIWKLEHILGKDD